MGCKLLLTNSLPFSLSETLKLRHTVGQMTTSSPHKTHNTFNHVNGSLGHLRAFSDGSFSIPRRADSVYRLVLMVLFTYIFIPGHLTPNKGNLSRVECSSIVLSHVQCFHSWQ